MPEQFYFDKEGAYVHTRVICVSRLIWGPQGVARDPLLGVSRMFLSLHQFSQLVRFRVDVVVRKQEISSVATR